MNARINVTVKVTDIRTGRSMTIATSGRDEKDALWNARCSAVWEMPGTDGVTHLHAEAVR